MRVSAKLQATAAPEAPAPMIRTSTTSSLGRTASGAAVALTSPSPTADVAPHPSSVAYRVEKRPVALFQHVAPRIRRARLEPQGAHHAVIAVVALQHGTPERRDHGAFMSQQRHCGCLRLHL